MRDGDPVTHVHTVVLDGRTARVEVDRSAAPRLLGLVVSVEGEVLELSVAGWRDVSFGSGDGTAYAWAARDLLVLLPGPGAVVHVDDDLVAVFRAGGRWLLVGETSVRVLEHGRTTARVELPDAAVSAAWDGDRLRLWCADGSRPVLGTPSDGTLLLDPGPLDHADDQDATCPR